MDVEVVDESELSCSTGTGSTSCGRGWDEPISNQTATADLRAMVAAGLLEQRGRNRGAYYEAAEPLRAVRVAAQRERKPIDTSDLFEPDATTTSAH